MAAKIKSSTITINYDEYITDTLTIDLTWKDSAGLPIDLTGYTGLLEVRSDPSDAVPLFSITELTGLVLGNTNSNILAELTPANLSTIGLGSTSYFIRLTEPSGKVNTLVTGRIVLTNP